MKAQPRLCSLVIAVSLLLVANLVNAAQAASGSAPPDTGNPYVLDISDGKLANGKGDTATLAKIADVLRDRYTGADIVMAPEIGKLRINDLKLRSTDLPETLEALRVASGYAFMWRQGGVAAAGVVDPTTGIPVARTESSLFFLYRAEGETPKRMVEVFNLSGYLERAGKKDQKEVAMNLDEIKRIIGETLQRVLQGTVGAENEPSFQFHPGANLLIVIGSSDAIEVSRKVIMALPGAAMASDNTARMNMVAQPQAGSTEPNDAAMRAFRRRYGLDMETRPPASNPSSVPTK